MASQEKFNPISRWHRWSNWLRALDEALHYDPDEARDQRISKLEQAVKKLQKS